MREAEYNKPMIRFTAIIDDLSLQKDVQKSLQAFKGS
jgi:hypothetical protein